MTDLSSPTPTPPAPPGEPIELTADDGTCLAGRYWPATGQHFTVVVVHGFAASKDDAAVVAMCNELAASGFGTLVLDTRGHGDSTGLCTLGDREPLDIGAAVAFARKRQQDVILVGASLGAISALRYAVDDPALAGVVSVSAPARWRLHSPQAAGVAAITRLRPGRWLAEWLFKVRVAPGINVGTPPEVLAPRIGCPVAIIHGKRDHFIPASEARRLHAALPGARRLELVAGMGHGFRPEAERPVIEAIRWAANLATHTTDA